jgi:alkylation response protein AidB-like acyl-CoA dehydrogenase
MDFDFTQDQTALRDLARKILGDHSTHERLKALTASGLWTDEQTWKALAQASLLGVAIPEEFGGSGMGLLELGLLCEEVGRAVAQVPVFASLVLGALPVAEFGSPAQKAALLPGVAAGSTVLTAGLVELGNDDPARPATKASRAGTGWRLDGAKIAVPAGDVALRVLVPAATASGDVGMFLVDPTAAGVTRETQVLTSGEPHVKLTMSGVQVGPGEVLGDPAAGEGIVRWLVDRATAAYCAVQLGVCEQALRMTAAYTTERKQFDRPIATFQAVQQRAADAYIDVETIRMATWEALYRLATGAPATEMVRIAKYCASDGGQRVVVAAQHLHGGIGVDVDYPLHRYFWWAKQIELSFGTAPAQLARMGADLAADASAGLTVRARAR